MAEKNHLTELTGLNEFGLLKKATQLGFEARKKVKEGDFSVFLFPFMLALIKDVPLDILEDIPFVGLATAILLSAPVSLYIFILMWGRGKWKVKLVRLFLLLLDLVPIVNIIPWTTASVYYAYHLAKKEAEENKKKAEHYTVVEQNLQSRIFQRRRQQERQMGRAVDLKKEVEVANVRVQGATREKAVAQNQANQARTVMTAGANLSQGGPAQPYQPPTTPSWMRDKSVDEAMKMREERLAVARRLGMDAETAARKVLEAEQH